MKTSELERLLKAHGCKFKENDKKLAVWYNPNVEGNPETEIWRHSKEVSTGTLNQILKDLKIKQ